MVPRCSSRRAAEAQCPRHSRFPSDHTHRSSSTAPRRVHGHCTGRGARSASRRARALQCHRGSRRHHRSEMTADDLAQSGKLFKQIATSFAERASARAGVEGVGHGRRPRSLRWFARDPLRRVLGWRACALVLDAPRLVRRGQERASARRPRGLAWPGRLLERLLAATDAGGNLWTVRTMPGRGTWREPRAARARLRRVGVRSG